MSILATHDQVPQIARPPTMVHRPAAPAAGMTGKDMIRAIRKRKWMIVISIALTTAITAVGTFVWLMTAPLYTAEALLAVTPPKNVIFNQGNEQTPREVIDRVANVQVRMVKSDPVVLSALNDENLRDTNWFKKDQTRAYQRLVDSIKVASLTNEGLVRISMTGTDPKEVARIVNAVAQAAEEEARRASRRGYLEQVNSFKSERQAREASLTDLNNQKMAVRPKDIPMIEEERNSLNLKLQQLTADIERLESMKSTADADIAAMKTTDMTHWPSVMAYIENDPTMRSLRMLKVNLETERDNMIRKYGPMHRTVQDLQTRLKSANEQIDAMQRELTPKGIAAEEAQRVSYQSKIMADLLDTTGRLEATKASQKGLEATLDKLRAFQEQQTRLNENISAIQKREMELSLIRPEDQISLRLPATAPRDPSMPDWVIMIPLGVVLGLIIGFGLTFLLEFMDTSVRSPGDITRRTDLPVLGMVPHVDDLDEEIADLRLAFASNPNSLVSEAFRQVRTCLMFSGPASERRSLLVTSAMPEDGRSTVSLNLAASVARSGRKVLVVDANFRQPAIRKLFPQCKDSGLSNVLVGQSNWRDLVCEIEPNLFVMSSGPLPPNPAELLGSPMMRQFLSEVLGKTGSTEVGFGGTAAGQRATDGFDQVIFDGAPSLVVSDSVVLATIVDGVVMVVRAGANTYGIVQRLRDILRRVNARVLGVTINGVRATAGGYLRKSYETFYDYHQQVLPGDKQ